MVLSNWDKKGGRLQATLKKSLLFTPSFKINEKDNNYNKTINNIIE